MNPPARNASPEPVPNEAPTPRLDRRRLLMLGATSAAALCVPGLARAARAPQHLPARTLSFEHLHTGERLRVTYFDGSDYVGDALHEINHVLRDHYSGEQTRIDPALLDLLTKVSTSLDARAPFQVISGYRSPTTNARLAAHSGGVARHSLHMEGEAIDVRLSGHRLFDLRRTAWKLQSGGVGYYPGSNFVHLDTGRIRFW
jgi:uncharacterized protein YcbK (DUF882 family)